MKLINRKNYGLICVIFCLIQPFELYEPLNLNAPGEYEIPTETFVLCNLSQDFLRNYCQNNGICYTLVDHRKREQKSIYSISDIYCSCPNEYTGPQCEEKISHEQIKQQNMATSEPNKTSNFSEAKLSSSLSSIECPAHIKCLNGGTCINDPVKGFKCKCSSDYIGLHCENKLSCPDMSLCNLKCEFGFKIDQNNCQTCSCSCVNEENFYEETKNYFNLKYVKKICTKSCKLGFIKDENNCFKCQCLEDTLTTPELYNPFEIQPKNDQQNFENFCQNAKCQQNQVCKYFDRSWYTCPAEIKNCKIFDNFSKFPICVDKNQNEACMEEVSVGKCGNSHERYFYDPIDKKCKKFFYSGCLGNRNNFLTIQECNLFCLKNELSHQNVKIDYQNFHLFNRKLLNETDNPVIQSGIQINDKFSSISTTKIVNTISFTSKVQSARLNETIANVKSEIINDPNTCNWVCELDCPFGYKIDYRTKCYKCECIELNMTECGVPCFPQGTSSCLHSMRANSRPKCVCDLNYDGVYCQIYKKSYNFSTRVKRSLKINKQIANDIKTNFTQKLSIVLDISQNQIVVNELRNNLKENFFVIKFTVYAPDFTNEIKFNFLVNKINNLLTKKNLTLNVLNEEITLYPNCEKNEEIISIGLSENYLFSSNKLKNIIIDLKSDIIQAYKLKSGSIHLVKLDIEPSIQLEILLKNDLNDPDFCVKSLNLKNDLQSNNFMPAKLKQRLLSGQNFSQSDENKLNYIEPLSSENLFLSRSSDFNTINQMTSSVFLNHSIAYLSVIASSFFIIFFLVSLFVITHLRRRQNKKIAKFDDSDSSSTFENYEKKSEFHGYFLPNYATVKTETSLARCSIDKFGVY